MDKRLENVFWLGGSPCAGKSSIAGILKNRFNINIYRVDVEFEAHRKKFNPEQHPSLDRWENSNWDKRWMQPVDNLVQDVIKCYSEHFSLVLEDVLAFPGNKRLLVEGTALLPREVFKVLPKRGKVIWVVPTFDFQKEKYSQREWVFETLNNCREPETAFENGMRRDAEFANFVASEVKELNLEWLLVDGSKTIEENAATVAKHFGFY